MKKLTPAQKLRAAKTLAEYDRIVQWCADYRLPLPKFEYAFHPSRKWRFDVAWPNRLVALEIEGAVWVQGRHTRGAGFLSDMEKYAEATVLGWTVIRVARVSSGNHAAVLYSTQSTGWLRTLLTKRQ